MKNIIKTKVLTLIFSTIFINTAALSEVTKTQCTAMNDSGRNVSQKIIKVTNEVETKKTKAQ